MKKGATGRTQNPKPKISGAIPLPVSEEDAGRLIGGVVEKGFSDDQQSRSFGPSAAPRPSVLPFPVARHRSHGPHWAPKVEDFNVVNGNRDMDDDVEEDVDGDRMDLVAAVSNPVQRKEKRGLDFSRWKEIADNERRSMNHGKKKERHMTAPELGHKAVERTSDKSMQIAELENAEFYRDSFSSGNKKQENLKMQPVQKSDMVSSFAAQKLVGGEDGSLESHIDSENRARLANMSADEIAEAQAEIMAKLNPGLINALKKRGQNKVRKQENSDFTAQRFVGGEDGSAETQIDSEYRDRLAEMSAEEITEAQAEVMTKLNPEMINTMKKQDQDKIRRQESSLSDNTSSETNSVQHEKNKSNITTSPENCASDKPVKLFNGDAIEDKNPSDRSPKNSGAWDAWSKRVECVRDMRFSLNGNIISSDFFHASNTGTGLSEREYNPNNVSERDFLRTEGDPGAAGYTIKEAVALTRSVVPGQRTLAFHLIAAILNRAVCNICQNQVGSSSTSVDAEGSVDWEAIWAFALGPEPELALSLRMSLDDNHNSVVLSCAKAIQCVLSYEMNETIFDILERTPIYAADICTAPVFRSKPDVNAGFLRGGFWKYNTKPSNILHFGEESARGKAEGEHTIQDDVIVAGQDVAAGLVRMGILPRVCYLLETDPSGPLEECLISILIAISRHSPTCAAAVMDSGKIVEIVASRFTSKGQLGINGCKIKSVTLFKVLAQLDKNCCLAFIKHGILRQVTWHLFRNGLSVDQWIKSGKEACKLLSALMVEQIRLWKAFIHYGYCISDFPDLFSSLCIWLSVPDFQKLIDNDVIDEYCAITKEVYLLLDVLAGRLPNFYLQMHEKTDNDTQDEQDWLWHQFGSVVDQALEWIVVKRIPHVSRLFDCQKEDGSCSWADSRISPILWVISSVLNMLSSLLKVLIPEDTKKLSAGHLPWLPEFVPKLGLEMIRNEYFRFSEVSGPIFDNGLSVVGYLCDLRSSKEPELAVSSSCCLLGVVQVVALVEKLIQHTNLDIRNPQFKHQFKHQHLSREDTVLANGMLKSSVVEIRDLLRTLEALISKEWQRVEFVDMFGRGGPAPGVGVGWGASGGGYWSLNTLVAQQDSRLLVSLLEVSEILSDKGPLEPGQIDLPMQVLNTALSACLIVGPGNGSVIDKLFKFIFQASVLKNLEVGIHQFLSNGKQYGSFGWKYTEEEFLLFANVLTTHFSSRWLGVKKKSKAMGEDNCQSQRYKKKENRTLETIHEDSDVHNTVSQETSFRPEWARQRLPLPTHWFLSAISTIENEKKSACIPGVSGKETLPSNFIDISKAGLFFLLGVEAMPTFLSSPVKHVPIVWKLHAMSVSLLSGMNVLHDEKSRDVFETLQNVYGANIDEKGSSLHFESDIHENYSTFVEMLVEQFAAESYGDKTFGRQVAIYLHRSVEASVRIATWNALSNARVLELLPPLPKCLTKAEGYLKPIEDNERVLESYVKSWVSGALDKAATRGSMAFSLVLHDLSSFIFGRIADNMLSLRNKLAKSLLRDYSRKQQHEGMMVKLISYQYPGRMSQQGEEGVCVIEKRLKMLKEMSDGNVTSVEKLENHMKREINAGRQLG